ncbi:MAG: lipoyl synthase [Actinomycetota bacterium]|nr:lipoyl synthase [Actinomycetota bacterium]MDK1016651.1 lipoyl synthase [Actinomycetota bacterium]MDK1026552.1 lipoyl synthase [Actinomycetota bacterium]MDK1038907.1 lipoyl synthase [Actinomycetota bacterium]MDK1097098.1 lipoyl synthase [Actinomycetota bacterium]
MGLAPGTQVTHTGVLRSRWLGRVSYQEAWDLQRAMWEGRTTGRSRDDYLLLLEHPHVYTVGRNGDGSNLIMSEDLLAGIGAELINVDRGGDITYHGPGQLVGYPIVAVGRVDGGFDVVGHVRRIERVLISTLADLGVEAWAESGLTGVWTGRGKVAAIGVRVRGGVSMHGFAINVDPAMEYFENIVPCGVQDRPVTSLTELLARPVAIEEVVATLLRHAAELSSASGMETQLGAFARGTASRTFEVDRMVDTGVFSPRAADEVPVMIRGLLSGEPEKPSWMKVRLDMRGSKFKELKKLNHDLGLNTVCEEAGCPNIYECWSSGTSTLMLLGDTCTRACSFCNVKTGRPGDVDEDEPIRAAEAISAMQLNHAVLTSVNRDDLPDGGATIFARTIHEIHERLPDCDVEVLIPDFKGETGPLDIVLGAKPAVLNHNTETVLRLQREIRTAANYARSLTLLARAKWANPSGIVKSGLIVGMGETDEEIVGALADLNAVGVDIVTIGQYLRPTARHRRIHRYVHPDVFDRYKAAGEAFGIRHVESGPLVRSSYHAREALTTLA